MKRGKVDAMKSKKRCTREPPYGTVFWVQLLGKDQEWLATAYRGWDAIVPAQNALFISRVWHGTKQVRQADTYWINIDANMVNFTFIDRLRRGQTIEEWRQRYEGGRWAVDVHDAGKKSPRLRKPTSLRTKSA